MYIISHKVYYSSFSAIEACTFHCPMIDFLRNNKRLDCTASVFKCGQEKRKVKMESTVWKYTVESIVHSICKIIWKLQCEFADVRINWFT